MHILTGYTYHLTEGPHLQLDDIASHPTVRYRVPIWGKHVGIKLLSTRYCIGGYDLQTMRSTFCPNRQQATGKTPYCIHCRQSIQFNPAFYNFSSAQLSKYQQHYNSEPHDVYLAYFEKNSIKVGIANAKRLRNRWLEQGARAAVAIQHMQDAYAARALELQISTTYSILERVTSTQKQQYLHVPYDFEQANRALRGYLDILRAEIDDISTTHSIEDLQKYYFAEKQPTVLYDPTNKNQHTIAGYVTGMVGDLLVYTQQQYSFIQPIKQLLGQAYVEFQESIKPLSVNVQTKLDLFG